MGYTIRSKNYHWSYNFQMMVPLSTRCESAFLHRDAEETDFVEQTQGYKGLMTRLVQKDCVLLSKSRGNCLSRLKTDERKTNIHKFGTF